MNTTMFGSMWIGMKLQCPRCQSGPMYEGRKQHDTCPNCGWEFIQQGDGDWLVTWIFSYTLAALVMVVSVVLMHFFTGLDLTTELILCAVAGVVAVGALFRNCKGMSAGVLYYLRVHWRE